ncbi:MAG: helix-turn-helix transcriptional regulator [Planctomycetota bacterium]|nr:helix-turn-helix transcriptional regulator [Planctomycetota bacterium]
MNEVDKARNSLPGQPGGTLAGNNSLAADAGQQAAVFHPTYSAKQGDLTALWYMVGADSELGVAVVTADVRVVFANAAWTRLVGGEGFGPLLGEGLRRLLPPECLDEMLRMMDAARRQAAPAPFRTIWSGMQLLTTFLHIPPSEGEDERYLIITRAMPGGIEQPQRDVTSAQFIRLGPLDILSVQELKVLALTGQGMSLKEIADVLGRSIKTIDNQRGSIARKLRLHDRVKLAHVAWRAGLRLDDAERKRV